MRACEFQAGRLPGRPPRSPTPPPIPHPIHPRLRTKLPSQQPRHPQIRVQRRPVQSIPRRRHLNHRRIRNGRPLQPLRQRRRKHQLQPAIQAHHHPPKPPVISRTHRFRMPRERRLERRLRRDTLRISNSQATAPTQRIRPTQRPKAPPQVRSTPPSKALSFPATPLGRRGSSTEKPPARRRPQHAHEPADAYSDR
jgi:hypothetical protein